MSRTYLEESRKTIHLISSLDELNRFHSQYYKPYHGNSSYLMIRKVIERDINLLMNNTALELYTLSGIYTGEYRIFNSEFMSDEQLTPFKEAKKEINKVLLLIN